MGRMNVGKVGRPRIDLSQDFWQEQILHGSTLSMQSVQNNGWIENDMSSSLNQARSDREMGALSPEFLTVW